jgi:hypothetical protein
MADTPVTLSSVSPAAEKALFGWPSMVAIGAAATGANTATLTAPTNAVGMQWAVTSVAVSFGAAVASASTLTILDGATVIWQVEISVAQIAPLLFNFDRPLHGSRNAAVQASLTTPGSVKSAISLAGFLVPVP